MHTTTYAILPVFEYNCSCIAGEVRIANGIAGGGVRCCVIEAIGEGFISFLELVAFFDFPEFSSVLVPVNFLRLNLRF